MARILGLALMVLMLAGTAEARGHHKKMSGAEDPSRDFSKHFDEEVKYDRDHSPDDGDGNPAPAPKKRRSHRHSKHAAEAPTPSDL